MRAMSALMVSAVALLGLAQPACADVKIGILMPLSGKGASYGQHQETAMKMALEELEKTGIKGEKVEVVVYDTRGENAEAINLTRKLIANDKVLAIIGPFSSGQVQVAAPAADRTGVVVMAMASSAPKLVANFKYAFRNTSDEGYMFDRVMRTLKAKGYPIATGAVAYANDDTISRVMGEKLLPGLMQKNGVQLKGSVDFKLGAFDFSAQVAQLKASPTDLVGVGAPPEAAIKLAQELRRQGHNGRLVAGSTINDPDLPERIGAAGNGTVVPSAFFGELNDHTRRFSAEFAKRAKAANLERTIAGQFDAATYDIVQYYAWAMKEGKVTGDPKRLAEERTAIRDALKRLKNFPALEGSISFGEDNDALKPVYIQEVRDGKWILLETHAAPN